MSTAWWLSSLREIWSGGVIAGFTIHVTAGEFAGAVTLQALLCYGPRGYFVTTPWSARDEAGPYRQSWLSHRFSGAVLREILAALELDEFEGPPIRSRAINE